MGLVQFLYLTLAANGIIIFPPWSSNAYLYRTSEGTSNRLVFIFGVVFSPDQSEHTSISGVVLLQ